MTVFAVEYAYAENSTELRDEHRPAHREYLQLVGAVGSATITEWNPVMGLLKEFAS